MSESIPNEQQKLVDECVAKLLEHFDSCRIFVTKHDGDKSDTAGYHSGGGNFYAQRGQISEWVTMQNQNERNYASKDDLESE